ncbi:hypothetical protein C4J92_3727 [Pseudomonas sp. R3-18-08]|nr:hypothetical protein C4J92_3727 [Pseudomonas sp. R3-18-08]
MSVIDVSADPPQSGASPNASQLSVPPSVGASLLAKNVNDNACFLNERGACEFFASKG